jgi:hypothetical protein
MMASDELSFIASVLTETDPELANRVARLIVTVRKLELFVDETVSNALEDARLAEASDASVVRLDRFRRVPINDGRTA